MLGHRLDDRSQKLAIREADPAGVGELEFERFAVFASKYVDVEEDVEAVAKELREAFLLYDRDCKHYTRWRTKKKKVKRFWNTLLISNYWFPAKGYITVEVLRDILHELDDKITPSDLDLMIDEIDADGSGTVDFEGKKKVMHE